MIYTKEALEAARLKVVGNPTVEERAYINGWNEALEAVINNFGVCGTELWIDSDELQDELQREND